MKTNLLIFLICIFLHNSLAMESTSEEDEIQVIKINGSEKLRKHMINFVENLYALRTKSCMANLQTHDFLHLNNTNEWEDLRKIYKLVKKRCSHKMQEKLTLYHQQTRNQLTAFEQGMELLSNDGFRSAIESSFPNKDIKTFFNDKFYKKQKMTPQKWLALRSLALNALHEQLHEKNTKETCKDMISQSHTCVSGTACGIGFMALFASSLWPFGLSLIGLGSCLCIGCQNKMYQDCRSEVLNYSSNEIDYKLQRALQISLLQDKTLESDLEHYSKHEEKECLIQKEQ